MTYEEIEDGHPAPSWVSRAADRAPSVQNSRLRSMRRAQQIVEAAHRLIATHGSDFTTHQLVKEAGIAVQTLYKHFTGKDQVMLAVLEEMIAGSAATMEEAGREIPNPVERLRFYVHTILENLRPADGQGNGRFLAGEHWRLMELYPDEVSSATQPIADMLQRALEDAARHGLLDPADPSFDAWLSNVLIRAVYHHYTFVQPAEPTEVIAERVFRFCLAAAGGTTASIPSAEFTPLSLEGQAVEA